MDAAVDDNNELKKENASSTTTTAAAVDDDDDFDCIFNACVRVLHMASSSYIQERKRQNDDDV